MIAISLIQNTPEWHQFRLNHFGASEAAAMLGICPYKTRDQLLSEKKTGVKPAENSYKKALFARGHQFEQWARPLAETIIGDELFPCVGVLDDTQLSASFDGITLDRSIVWEHKLLSQPLRQIMQSGDELPLHYRVQLEQQLLVSGAANKAVFMASLWDENGALVDYIQREYLPDLALRQRIIHGWQQFAQDLAEYQVKSVSESKTEIDSLPALPALKFEPRGDLSFSTNLAYFQQQALTTLNSINRHLLAESDFAQAEQQIKWCKTGEAEIAKALTALIEQSPDLNEILSTIKTIQGRMRDIRLDLDKQVKAEKARIKNTLIKTALDQVKAHYQAANVDYIEADLLLHQLESAIKGLKNLDKMKNAMDRVVIAEKTVLTQRLESGELDRLVKLSEINQAITPLSISVEGLKQLGFVPAATDKATILYKAIDFPKIIQRLSAHLGTVQLAEPLAKTA